MRELVHSDQLYGHQAVVVGAARSGRAAARLLHALGARVRWLEKDEKQVSAEDKALAAKNGWELISGEHETSQFVDGDLVVLSPGVPRRKLEPFFPGRPLQVVAEMELASWFVSAPMIAVTGTNGKSTTTTVIGHVLAQAGKKVFTGGNLGVPLAEYVLDEPKAEVLVLEVSSFQSQNFSSFRPHVGVLLNFSANHLDYHQDMEEYLSAKLQMFARQQEKDLAVLPLTMKEQLEKRDEIKASRVYFVATNRFHCPSLPGTHNQENLEAAYLACRYFGVDESGMNQALESYTPLDHRIEIVAEKNGILFVDDSKATTVDALKAALQTFDRPVILLAGGVFKGGNLKELISLMKEKVKAVALYGGSREIFEDAWGGAITCTWDEQLEDALSRIAGQAKHGDVILLSPATSSFDQYNNYKERGNAFQKAVNRLVKEKA